MSRETCRVTFQPEGRSVFVLRGTTLVEAAGQAGVILNQPCGGEGTCGKCRVEVLGRAPEPTDADRRHLSAQELAEGWRLACRLRVESDMVVSVPQGTRFFEQVILAEGRGRAYPFEPAVRAADATERLWGVAFDIGTTTVVGALLDLTRQTEMPAAVASRTNPQVHFGDDVVSRIAYCEAHADGLDRLRERIVECLNEIVAELCESAGVKPECICDATAVGNTTMTHILLGVDPGPLGRAPYAAVVLDAADANARGVGLRVNPKANLHVLPNIAGFVGSDTVAVVLASGMALDEPVQMAIDIGTNGEVVIGNRDGLLACSCAAGPAFEGARIRFGMRAAEGAVSTVVVNEGIEVGVIGGGPAAGICGSGLVDAVAVLLDEGVLDEGGRIADPHAPGLREPMRRAITELDGQPAVTLVAAEGSRSGRPILLTQRDVRELQLAKAAIRAGVEVLAQEHGAPVEALHRILLAGGFGSFIRRSSAQRIGLLPPVPSERIECIGNAAAAGARIALTCRHCRAEADRIRRATRYVELAGRPDFQQRFAEALGFSASECGPTATTEGKRGL